MTFHVIIKPGYPWTTARVSGRVFHRTQATVLHESEMNDEMRASGLLVVTEIVDLGTVEMPAGAPVSTDKDPEPPAEPPAPPVEAVKPAARKTGGK